MYKITEKIVIVIRCFLKNLNTDFDEIFTG